MRTHVIIALATILGTGHVSAQTTPPSIVTDGLALLEAGKCDSAFSLWAGGWTGPSEAGKREQLVASCATLGQLGALRGHDLIRIVTVTPHLCRTYFLLRYANQPVYGMLVAYQADTTWKVTSVNWNTIYDRVIPPDLFGIEHPAP